MNISTHIYSSFNKTSQLDRHCSHFKVGHYQKSNSHFLPISSNNVYSFPLCCGNTKFRFKLNIQIRKENHFGYFQPVSMFYHLPYLFYRWKTLEWGRIEIGCDIVTLYYLIHALSGALIALHVISNNTDIYFSLNVCRLIKYFI